MKVERTLASNIASRPDSITASDPVRAARSRWACDTGIVLTAPGEGDEVDEAPEILRINDADFVASREVRVLEESMAERSASVVSSASWGGTEEGEDEGDRGTSVERADEAREFMSLIMS